MADEIATRLVLKLVCIHNIFAKSNRIVFFLKSVAEGTQNHKQIFRNLIISDCSIKDLFGVCHFSWVSSDVRREKNWTSTRGKVTPTRGRAGPWHEPAAIWTPRTGKYYHSTHKWTSSINESKSVLLFYMFYWIQCGYLIWK